MSVARRFSTGVVWMMAGNWLEQILNLAVFVLLARLLGAEVFGLAMMAVAFIVLAEFLVRETLTEGLISRLTVDVADCDATFWSLTGLSLIAFLAVLLSADPLARLLYQEPMVAPVIRALSPTILLIGLTAVPVALLRRDLRFKALSMRAVAGVAAGGIVGIVMAMTDHGIWSLVGQRLTQVFVNAALAWGAVSWRPGRRARAAQFRGTLGFGSQVLGLRAAELIAVQSPAVLIGATIGPAAVGAYAVAWRMVEIATFLINRPVQMVAQPAFAELRRTDGPANHLLSDITKVATVIALPAFAGMAVLAGPLVHLLFGSGWAASVPVLQILCLLGAYLCVERMQTVFCLAAGRARGLACLAVIEAACGIAAMIFAAPFGLAAVTAAFVARYVLLWPLRFALVRRLGGAGLGQTIRILAPVVPGTAIMAGLVWIWCWQANGAWSPAVIVITGTAIGLAAFGSYAALVLRQRLSTARSLLRGDVSSSQDGVHHARAKVEHCRCPSQRPPSRQRASLTGRAD
ncbi:lipopolysaccharide biosynthesis protein [Pseudoruegeria sp. SK021]|uniref:lipopolysaccharide biosynthesis protein n=1 Tax=Pseudoruegeria sp. SK021 TaxID=1933035 RepID=UPI000A2151A0|nr:lipopolysaccharide biosynthesis protein [Pseudoruegeria sp. SK021]OSP54788.1 hypothetical protein BV911_10725 [Pseudoruegeria sp. SK021]